jgi:hypothetical protein
MVVYVWRLRGRRGGVPELLCAINPDETGQKELTTPTC